MTTRIFLAAFTTLALCSASTVHAVSIGINFVGGQGGNGDGAGVSSLAPTDTAGVVVQANWNNGGTASGGPQALMDSNGDASGASVSWTSNNTWSITGGAPADGDSALMNGYLDTNTTSVTSIDVANIPYSQYDAYVYFDGDGTGRSGNYSANGELRTNLVDAVNWPVVAGGGTFFAANADNTTGNYSLFTDLSGDLAITGQANNFRGPINGIQIVDTSPRVPEPATAGLVLLGLSVMSLTARRRRRR